MAKTLHSLYKDLKEIKVPLCSSFRYANLGIGAAESISLLHSKKKESGFNTRQRISIEQTILGLLDLSEGLEVCEMLTVDALTTLLIVTQKAPTKFILKWIFDDHSLRYFWPCLATRSLRYNLPQPENILASLRSRAEIRNVSLFSVKKNVSSVVSIPEELLSRERILVKQPYLTGFKTRRALRKVNHGYSRSYRSRELESARTLTSVEHSSWRLGLNDSVTIRLGVKGSEQETAGEYGSIHGSLRIDSQADTRKNLHGQSDRIELYPPTLEPLQLILLGFKEKSSLENGRNKRVFSQVGPANIFNDQTNLRSLTKGITF